MNRSVDSILLALKTELERPGSVLNPDLWIEAAFTLNLMLGDEQTILFKRQQEIAQMENEEYEKCGKMTVAKNIVRATNLYREYKCQEAKVKNCEEFVRLAKLRSKMSQGNY